MYKNYSYSAVVCLLLLQHSNALADSQDYLDSLYNGTFDHIGEQKPGLSMSAELGLITATGNTETASIKAAIDADHELDTWSNSYNAEVLYTESDLNASERAVTAQRVFANTQFDYKFDVANRRMFVYADYENDRFNGYDYRATFATGWAQRLWQDDKSQFRYSLGPGYSFIEPETDEVNAVNSGVVFRASAVYRYQWETGARFRQFVSTEAGSNNTRSRTETSLSATLIDSLAMKLTLILIHESNPQGNNASLSSETSVSLVYQFF